MATEEEKAVKAQQAKAAQDEAKAGFTNNVNAAAGSSRVGRSRRERPDKEERVPMNQLSAEEREARREQARTSNSGQGQHPSKGVAAALAAGRRAPKRFTMRRRASKIIYFIDGPIPEEADYDASMGLGQGVVFRNARKIVLGAPLENCDAVAGEVPADYAAVFPSASENMEVDDSEETADVLVRPNRQLGTSMNPDDVRPGTVDDGIAHATGTGSSQPGVRNADPTLQGVPAQAQGEARELSSAWKAAKTPGNIASGW